MLLFVVSMFLMCGPDGGTGTDDGSGDGGNGDSGSGDDGSGDDGNALPEELEDVKYLDMVSVDGGEYKQYDGYKEFGHTISDFSIGEYEVTYELWHTVRKWAVSNGYKFGNAGREGNDGTDGAAPTNAKYEPVTMINWRDAVVWCNAYSEMMEYAPVYKSGDAVLKDSLDSNGTVCDAITCDWTADGFRLPTEGEWQYCASDRGSIPWNWASGAAGNYEEDYGHVAWYGNNSGDGTHVVGTKASNVLGLHDMSGNVWEWCWDWYEDYPSVPKSDYRGPDEGFSRIRRGGGWNGFSNSLQVGRRLSSGSDDKISYLGFRVARG